MPRGRQRLQPTTGHRYRWTIDNHVDRALGFDRQPQYDCPVDEEPDSPVPDFESLYGNGLITARMAARLWYVADCIEGMYFDGMAELWLDQLPRIAKFHIDDQFTTAFGQRFGVLAGRIAAGLDELSAITTCTADELALHMVIDRADELLQEGGLDIGWIDALPHRADDDDLDGAREYLFYDLDVLHLYDPAADGLEDPGSAVYQVERFVNLHPRDWFKPFS